MDVVDVGTGLGILVRGPDFTLVYDGGSNDDLAQGPANRMLAYIKAVAPDLKTIYHMILSHPHQRTMWRCCRICLVRTMCARCGTPVA